MNPMTIVKFIGCWFCIIAVVVLLVLSHQPVAVAAVLGILAIAFANAPTTW